MSAPARARRRALLTHRRLPGATALIYRRLGHVGRDRGLLLDILARAETTGDHHDLTTAATAFTSHYRRVFAATAEPMRSRAVVGKLYRDRAAPGGRLDTYHAGVPWLVVNGQPLFARNLATTPLLVNGRHIRLDFSQLTGQLRDIVGAHQPVWSAIAQGDPTLFNLAWHPSTGPTWLDYDTAGQVSVPGEFAVMLAELWMHGPWLTPVRAPMAYRDHPTALTTHKRPAIRVSLDRSVLAIDVDHNLRGARAVLAHAWLRELVEPVAADLGITDPADLTAWLRPWLAMRLLTVHRPADLPTAEAALLLAALADLHHPDTDLPTLLGATHSAAGSSTLTRRSTP